MTDPVYVGIDPGFEGAVGFVYPDGTADAVRTPLLAKQKKPKAKPTKQSAVLGKKRKKAKGEKSQYDIPAMAAILRPLVGRNVVVVIEEVGAQPTDGSVSAFRFGTGYGIWLGVVATLGLPLIKVRPAIWRPVMVGPKTDKKQSLVVCRKLYPQLELPLVKDADRAEAVLIATYIKEESRKRVVTQAVDKSAALNSTPFRAV